MKHDGSRRVKINGVITMEKYIENILIILSTSVRSSQLAISIRFNGIDTNVIAGYEECTLVLYMIRIFYL